MYGITSSNYAIVYILINIIKWHLENNFYKITKTMNKPKLYQLLKKRLNRLKEITIKQIIIKPRRKIPLIERIRSSYHQMIKNKKKL